MIYKLKKRDAAKWQAINTNEKYFIVSKTNMRYEVSLISLKKKTQPEKKKEKKTFLFSNENKMCSVEVLGKGGGGGGYLQRGAFLLNDTFLACPVDTRTRLLTFPLRTLILFIQLQELRHTSTLDHSYDLD